MKFGKSSTRNLAMLDFDLQWLCREVLNAEIMDFTIIESYRDEETQNRYFKEGKSKLKWPNSKHNKNPSRAMDCVPYINGRLSWDKLHFCILAGVMLTMAKKLGIKIRWGGDWSGDVADIGKQAFDDYAHFELIA